jgi:hypothetical protein
VMQRPQPWLDASINLFALWICAFFAGLVLQGAIDDYGLDLENTAS